MRARRGNSASLKHICERERERRRGGEEEEEGERREEWSQRSKRDQMRLVVIKFLMS